MATRGKSINLFLMDGTAIGRIKCTLSNWTGIAYKIPRTELDKCRMREDLSQSGVYFLFGSSEKTGEGVVYIGQAGVRKNGEGLLYRLQEHKRSSYKDYWTEAVVFTTSNNSFGPTEISYLENRFCMMAMNAGRYVVQNGNEPTSGNVTEEKESELEEFIDNAIIVMGTLGHKLFVPLVETSSSTISEEGIMQESDQVFHIRRSGANARAQLTTEGIVVLAGSSIRKDIVPSCPDYIKKLREDNKDDIDDGIMKKDMLFKSPSGASSFVLGSPTNGNMEWRTEEGKVFKDLEASELG